MKTIIHPIQRQAIGRLIHFNANYFKPCFKVVAEPEEKAELPSITIDARFIGKAKYRI